jgi:DNA-binding response OmpR family regulator
MGIANEIAPAAHPHPLEGARILVVEDNFFIGIELATILTEAGATVVGPFQTVRSAQSAIASTDDAGISAAVLDLRLGTETVAPVARRLSKRHVPFIFYTGQSGSDPLRAEWPNSKVVSKPASPSALVQAVASLLGLSRAPARP